MQAGLGSERGGYTGVMRMWIACLAWLCTVLGHDAAREVFVGWGALAGKDALIVARWTGVALILVGAGLLPRVGWRGIVLGAAAAVLVAVGHTAGEALHVVQYAFFAWLGGRSPWWLVAGVVDEGWEAAGGSPFDYGDVLLEVVGVGVAWGLGGGGRKGDNSGGAAASGAAIRSGRCPGGRAGRNRRGRRGRPWLRTHGRRVRGR